MELQLDFLYDPQGPIEQGDGDIALASLQSLLLLDKALPSRLKATDRRYDLAFNGDLEEWREYLQIVVPLSVRSDLTLYVDCTLIDPETTWYHSPSSSLPGDVESLAAVFEPKMQACITSLSIRVDGVTRARPVAEWKMYLPRVSEFTLYAPEDNSKWPMHIMHQLFSNLSMPKLKKFTLVSRADTTANNRYIDIIEVFLPLWTHLEKLTIETFHVLGEGEPRLENEALEQACRARSIRFEEAHF